MNNAPENIGYILIVSLFILLVCAGVGTCRKYEYDECIKVGHSPNYCKMQAAGCFDRRGNRK